MAITKIGKLIFSFFDMVGIKYQEVEPDVWHAKVTESERAFFNNFDDIQFTFTRELAEQHRNLELICEGSFLLRKIIERLGEIPKTSQLFSNREPEMPPSAKSQAKLRVIDPKKVYYRQKVVFNFKVQFDCDKRQENLYSIEADPADSSLQIEEGLKRIDLSEYSETPQDEIKIEQSETDVLRLYLQACQELEEKLTSETETLRNWGEEQCKVELEKFEDYLDEQKQELLKRKENVCFHLYFFQKEEEIDSLIANLEAERKRKLSELQEKFALKVRINLVSAVTLCIPTIGIAGKKKAKKSKAKSVSSTALKTKTAM